MSNPRSYIENTKKYVVFNTLPVENWLLLGGLCTQ